MEFGVVTVAAIIVIAYLVGMAAKNVEFIADKWVPVICGVVGAVLGVVGMYTIPDFPATDILTAMAVGIASGLAATGVHQIAKQQKKDTEVTDNV